MKKKLVTVLVVIAIVLALVVAGALGFLWYRDNHVFVEGDPYPLDTKSVDLREMDISFDYYYSLTSQLPDCYVLWNVPFQGSRFPSDSKLLKVSDLSQEDMEILLKYFPALETLDATSGNSLMNYQILETFQAEHPECWVLYEVDLGGKRVEPDTAELVLENGDYDFVTLMRNLTYLRELKSLKLRLPELTAEQIEEIRTAFPEIAVSYTVEVFHQEYETDTTELDLSSMTDEDAALAAEQIKLLPNLTYVNLNTENGIGALSLEGVKGLVEAAPHVVFDFAFDFYGHKLSTADEEVHIKKTKIGDEGEQNIRNALDLLKNCKRFVLEYCQVSYDVLAKIRDDYRDQTKVVWRVEFGGGSTLTDVEVIRCTYDLVDDNCENLKYCEDVRFVDFGHNEWLDGCDFVAGMTSLEYCILSGAPIKSLEPFANCKNLKFLEIAFCEYIEDLTPLASCENLQMLNISNTHALDLSPLDNLPLTHFCARTNPSGVSRISQDEQARFQQQHPDCWSSFAGPQPYGSGWRYGEDEITPLPQYALVQSVFKLPHAPNNTGWYLDEGSLALIESMYPAPAETVPEATEEAVTE